MLSELKAAASADPLHGEATSVCTDPKSGTFRQWGNRRQCCSSAWRDFALRYSIVGIVPRMNGRQR
jgi:hypothetical protein